MLLILVIVLVVIIFGGVAGPDQVGGYGFGWGHWGVGLPGLLLVILLVWLLLGHRP